MADQPASPTPRRLTLIPTLGIGVLSASTASIFILFAQNAGAPSILIAAYRLTIASLLLAPLALARYRSELGGMKGRQWLLLLLAGAFLALHFASWITSLAYTSVASSVVLVSTTPLWVALISPLVLRERIGPIALLGILLALLGGTVVALSDACTMQAGKLTCPTLQAFFSGRAITGDLLALIGAWMASGYLLVGRKARARLTLIPYIFVVYSMAALVLIAILFGFREKPFGYNSSVLVWCLLLALIPQLVGHSTYNWALKYLPASFVAVTLLGEPIGSSILAFFIFQQSPGWFKVFGGLFILAGLYLATRSGEPT
jgi:drug/metabolite transporter (DMT)-like permease